MMKKLSLMRVVKSLVLVGALILPAVSWADDHLLDVVGATVFLPATVTDAGAVTHTLDLTNFDNNATLSFGATGGLTVNKALVKICSTGTGGNLEWLDQGLVAVSVSGTMTSVTPNTYTLTLTPTPTSDTYGSSNGACGAAGQKTYSYTNTALINLGAINKLTSTYNFWNVSNGVPVPGTILLMLIGMAGLGWMSIKRRRQM